MNKGMLYFTQKIEKVNCYLSSSKFFSNTRVKTKYYKYKKKSFIMILWHTLGTYFRNKHKKRVQKIPLDYGASCPNRDGTLGKSGCIFCDNHGSGSGFWEKGLDLEAQWNFWKNKYEKTDSNRDFLAYFQSFSNTYGSIERLKELVFSVQKLSNNVGLAVGTRPDCIDETKLDVLANCSLPYVWIEYGLQSCHDKSLKTLQRKHSVQQSEQAIKLSAERGLKVCGHLMAGLPGESEEDFLESLHWALSLPINGLKIHNLFVPQNTIIANWYKKGVYTPLSMKTYVEILAKALPIIPSHIVMHRLTGDPAPGQCLAPEWAKEKRPVFTALIHRLKELKAWQGSLADAKEARPSWYGS